MSEKKRPFAEARNGRLIVGGVTVNYDFGETARIDRDRFPEIAAVVNASFAEAVAAREANLVAALRQVLDALDEAHELHASGAVAMRATIAAMADAIRAGSAALDGTGPDVVAELRAQVEALKAASGPWALLADVVQEGGLAGERSAEVMRALGLPVPKSKPCDVHPHVTEGEIKTIGLVPREGQTDHEAYAEWSRKRGKKCVCGRDPRPIGVAPRTVAFQLIEQVREQHQRAVEQATQMLLRSSGAEHVEQMTETAPVDGALVRDTVWVGHVQIEVTTRLRDGVAQTTAQQADRRDFRADDSDNARR